jgi:hypothetical protein
VSSTPFTDDASGAPTVIVRPRNPRLNAVDSGDFTFNPDGTGTQSGRGDEIDVSTTAVGASISDLVEFSAPFSYVIEPDNTIPALREVWSLRQN